MTEKLIIQNFLSITSLEIELRAINVFIGKQAVGKSVCIKLAYFFKEVIWQLLESSANQHTKREFDAELLHTFTEFFPQYTWAKSNFTIRYEVGELFIEISRSEANRKRPILKYSDPYKREFDFLKKQWAKTINSIEVKDFSSQISRYRDAALDDVAQKFPSEVTFDQLFIPSGRSFFAVLQKNIFSFLSSNNDLDPFLAKFGSMYENIKLVYNRARHSEKDLIPDEITRIVENILQGDYIYHEGEDLIKSRDGRVLNIVHSSSGQQETLPLVIILSALSRLVNKGAGRAIYIEEPEAHVFPDSQRSIVELIATVYNLTQETPHQKTQFFITTHSPYVLAAFNNLIQAGEIYQRATKKSDISKIHKILPRHKSLLLENIAVYSLEKGRCVNLISDELGLIDTNIIDEVSNQVSIEFGQLLDLVG
jgi:AAA15 family ATPase/GTPase